MAAKKIVILLIFLLYWSATAVVNAQNPILLSTNVLENGHVEIRWDIPIGDESARYAIQRWNYLNPDGQGFDTDLAVVDASERVFIDESSLAISKKQIYLIYNKDAQALQSEEMQTIFLYEDIDYQECELTNTIQWTGFFSSYDPVQYIISYSTDGGISYTQITVLTSGDLVQTDEISTYENTSPQQTPVYTFTHENLEPGLIYTYKVEASYEVNGQTYTSSSNSQSRDAPAYGRPNPPIIKAVSVNENNEIEIFGEITADGPAVIRSTALWKTESENPVDLSFFTDLNQISTGEIDFTDLAANANQTAFWYSIVLQDYCDFSLPEFPAENAHRSIFLAAEVRNNEQVELSWNAYEGWTPDRYRVFRKTTTDAYIEIAATQQTSYTDNTIAAGSESGRIIYFVQAVTEDPETGAELISASNRIQVGFDSPFVVPNAFRPSSGIVDNQSFKPLSRFAPAGNYLFQVYDRWGKLIFETTDFSKGWDGQVNGSEAAKGVYLWRYSYNNSEGNTIEDKGTVMLVR